MVNSVQRVSNSYDEQCHRAWQIEEKGHQGSQGESQQNQSYLEHQEWNGQTKAQRTSAPKKHQQHHEKLHQPEGSY